MNLRGSKEKKTERDKNCDNIFSFRTYRNSTNSLNSCQ